MLSAEVIGLRVVYPKPYFFCLTVG